MTDPLDDLIDRPKRAKADGMMDPLSDVLRAVRLTGGVFLDAQFTAPWCVTAQLAPEDCKPFLTSPAQLIAYHFVIEGSLLLGSKAPLRWR